MKSTAFMQDCRSFTASLVLLLGIFIGLGAQEIPYVVYGPQDQNWGNDNFDSYHVWDLISVGDLCYYLSDNTHVGLIVSNTYYGVGYLMQDSSTNSFLGSTNPQGRFLTKLGDSVVLGEIQTDSGFKWTTYNAANGQTNHPFITFEDYGFSIPSRAIATSMDDNHILVVFHNDYIVKYASCMDLDYNEIWGFSLEHLGLDSNQLYGGVFALDSQRFLLMADIGSTTQLYTFNSSGINEHQSTVSDYCELFQTNIPGTVLMMSRQQGSNVIELSKIANNTISPLLTIDNVGGYGRFKADADASSIVVLYQLSNGTSELRKYAWEGNLIWAKPLPWRWINNAADNLAINDSGSIYFSMRDTNLERNLYAKILADGSDTFTENEDPTASPTIPALSVYPNPFSDALHMKLELGKHIDLSIYNLKGQLVRSYKNLVAGTGNLDLCWDAKDEHGCEVPNGVYLIRAKSQDGIRQSKCIKFQ